VYDSDSLTDRHDLTSFDSGQPVLDKWLRRHAGRAHAKRHGKTYIWHAGDNRAMAYFTLCPHLIERSNLPLKLARGDVDRIPAILLARLALDRELYGQGLGAELLLDALSRAVSVSNQVGGRYVVVDAIDESAAKFYTHYGFNPCADSTALRLVRKVSDIAVSLG
jgi:GNAT superfamily N-acetyltransferase